MVERKADLNVQQDREYLIAENDSYKKLMDNGFKPQGCTKDFKRVVVFVFLEGHQHGEKEVHYFKNWQEAAEKLCN